jgi:hypothetical protein
VPKPSSYQIRITELIESAFEAGSRELNAEFRIARATDDALRWIEARNIIFYDREQRPCGSSASTST